MCTLLTPAGEGWDRQLTCTLALLVGSTSVVFSYDTNTALSSAARTNVAATGSVVLSVLGAGFATAGHTLVAHTQTSNTLQPLARGSRPQVSVCY